MSFRIGIGTARYDGKPGWIVLGFGIAAGLDDAAYSTLERIFGSEARHAIAQLTLRRSFAYGLVFLASPASQTVN